MQVNEKEEEVISRVQSAVSARRLLDEIASGGGYKVIGLEDDFTIYGKSFPERGVYESVTAKKIADRVYEVRKTITKLKGGEGVTIKR